MQSISFTLTLQEWCVYILSSLPFLHVPSQTPTPPLLTTASRFHLFASVMQLRYRKELGRECQLERSRKHSGLLAMTSQSLELQDRPFPPTDALVSYTMPKVKAHLKRVRTHAMPYLEFACSQWARAQLMSRSRHERTDTAMVHAVASSSYAASPVSAYATMRLSTSACIS